MNQVYYVVILVIRPQRSEYQLLLARRREGQYMGGTWQLISGGLEPKEGAWNRSSRHRKVRK